MSDVLVYEPKDFALVDFTAMKITRCDYCGKDWLEDEHNFTTLDNYFASTNVGIQRQFCDEQCFRNWAVKQFVPLVEPTSCT